MKKSIRIIIPLSIILLLSGWGLARTAGWFAGTGKEELVTEKDGRSELRKLLQRYTGEGDMADLHGEILLYDAEGKKSLKERSTFRSVRNGNAFYSQLAAQYTYVADGLLVQLDTLSRTILVVRVDVDKMPANIGAGLLPLEQLMEDSAAFRITATVKDTGKERMLSIQHELMPEIRSCVIYYDPATYTIRKTEVEWWKFMRGTTQFNGEAVWFSEISYDTNRLEAPDIGRDIRKIVKVDGNTVVAAEKYASYEIIAQLDEPR
ncbi:MAG: hypothetical protein P0Y53_16420 [Candidatus Pseudobacter hemicellulosilyticus]|uniref:Uncharacterized protein n=1 Tax=Candidatus Pseudobacter hemicellulosilyticus TaxID=3121375 RepID=A0AAJ5WPA1_9BACT|nr:MAG: hypothetical protein P0Y53_16420 [Pseudobacter sp.]